MRSYFIYFTLISIIILLISCNNFDDEQTCTLAGACIVGQWELSEAFISEGGPQYWTDIEDGRKYSFLKDGTFESIRFLSCTKGIYKISENELILEYECDNEELSKIENSNGEVTYNISFETNSFILTPSSGPICTEGCSYRFKKII